MLEKISQREFSIRKNNLNRLGCYLERHNVKQREGGVICKAFNNTKLTNNDYIGLGRHKKQHLLFSLVLLILCYAILNEGIKLCL